MFPNCPSKKIDVLEEAGPMPDERFADEHGVLSILTLNIFFIKKVLNSKNLTISLFETPYLVIQKFSLNR